jgi:chromosome segregation ATPase
MMTFCLITATILLCIAGATIIKLDRHNQKLDKELHASIDDHYEDIDDLLKAEVLIKDQEYHIWRLTCKTEEQEEKLEQLEQSKEELEEEFEKAYRVTEEQNINYNKLTVDFNRLDQDHDTLKIQYSTVVSEYQEQVADYCDQVEELKDQLNYALAQQRKAEDELYDFRHALKLIRTRTETATGSILNDDRYENSRDGVTRYKVYRRDHHTYIQRNDLSAYDRWSFYFKHENSVKIARQFLRAVWGV